jgi:transcriptional regulator with XRE-family HTH domain
MDGLGRRLRQLREAQHLTTERLGAVLGVSGTAVRNWEAAEKFPRAGHVVAICTAFSVSADWLLGLEK